MNWHLIEDVLRNSLLITGLVITMMMMIEYFNTQSHGKLFLKLTKSKFRQILFGATLGMIPGCLGGFAAISLFTHGFFSLGALIATMISTSGDEAFLILAIIPQKAFILFGTLFFIAIITGLLIDFVFYKKQKIRKCSNNFEIHAQDEVETPSLVKLSSYRAILKPSRERIIIFLGIILFITAVIMGILQCSHPEHNASCGHVHSEHCSHGTHPVSFNILNEQWINVIFAIVSSVTLLFTATAKEHFIKEHIWNHIIKKHFISVFLWTFGILTICQLGLGYFNITHWINDNMPIVILLAALVGLIPQSGPHLIFITLFAQGALPFYILLVNSIVQDGHTTLPLLASNKRDFIKSKIINMIVGLIIGFACWALL